MALTIGVKTFSADSFQKDSVGYIGPDKTVTMKDDLKMSRTAAKPTSVFSGLSRAQAKLTRTLALTGALTPQGDCIITVDVAVPVGALAADIEAVIQDIGDLVQTASFEAQVEKGQISF